MLHRSHPKVLHALCAALALGIAVGDACAQFSTPNAPGGSGSLLQNNRKKKPELLGLSLSATGEQVVELRIVGNKTIPTTQIVNQLQTRAGRPFDPKIVERDVRKLSSLPWFVEVKPLYEQTPQGPIVIFEVTERPTIRYVDFLGNRRIRDKKLAKEIGLKVGGSVDPFAVEDGRRKMLDLYRRNGFNKTQITVLEGNRPTDQGVIYVINEGISQRVWKTEFVGCKFVSERRLRTQVESKRPTAFLFGGFVDRDQIEADVQRVTDYYRKFGFYQAKVGRKIEFNENGTWATITFIIDEGPRYNVRNVEFMGNSLFEDSSIAMGITLNAGQPFERAKMQADLEWLKELYGSQGYIFADIRAEQVLLEEPGQLDLVYRFDEGKRWRVGNIYVNISGDHPHTRIQTALNRLSIHTGDIVDIREVRASERRLHASGLFLNDPIQGIAPKITFRIPELEEVEFSAGEGPDALRGQSPDPAEGPARVSAPVPTTTAGPPVLPPPSAGQARHQVRRPASDNEEFIDIYLDFNSSGADHQPAPSPTTSGDAPQVLSPTARVHTVHYPPAQPAVTHGAYYPVQPQVSAPPAPVQPPSYGSPWVAAQSQPQQPTTGNLQVAPPGGGAYNNITVRTQSPYQPAAAPMPPSAVAGYGGQLPAATSPQGAPIGHHSAPIQQVQYTEAVPPGTAPYATPLAAPPPQQTIGSPGAITPIPPTPGFVQPAVPFGPVQPFPDPAVDVIVDVAEAPTGRFQIGAGINSDAGVVGNISLDERNFDWRNPPTSWNDFATGRAWRGGGQHLRLEAAPGTQVQRYLASFQEPHLWDSNVSLGLSGSYFERRFRDWDEERLGGRVSLGYQWIQHDLSAIIAYRGENVNINDINPIALAGMPPAVPALADVQGDNALHGFQIRLANDTRDSPFFPTEGHLIDLSFEQVVGSFEYPRAILDIREYGLIHERPDHSGRHVLSASMKIGYTGDDTPIYENFFAGGYSTLRGFDFRGASPVVSGIQVGGRFMWINSLEYLFPLTADDMMHGVVFVDFGTVEEDVNIDIDRVRVAPGVGLRITVPAMGPAPIALDFAWGIERAATDDLQVFSFNVGFTR